MQDSGYHSQQCEGKENGVESGILRMERSCVTGVWRMLHGVEKMETGNMEYKEYGLIIV